MNQSNLMNVTKLSKQQHTNQAVVKELSSNRMLTSCNIANSIFIRKHRAKSFDGMSINNRINTLY